ncbi:MAG: RagB/SusD family nutrient uptake outer membrane protein [Prevotella sp.]|nr:RagB/SusD family nutrient uptake outer membrane protein [Prevotella sp.]
MNKYIKTILPVAALALTMGMTSCTGDLDVTPIDPNLDLESTPEGLLNKCYANFAMQGNQGGNEVDIDGFDGGTVGLVRQMWNSNELTSDEAICGWGDAGITEFVTNTYGDQHPMLYGYYSRLTTGITYCNQYIAEKGGHDATMTAEARFLRAFQYYLIMDAWGSVPFATEPLATPRQISREEAYEWILNEVLDLEPALSDAKAKKSSDKGYGRVDKAAAWMLLARLYLNAEVYTGTAQWAKAAEYAKKVMDSDYKIHKSGANQWSAYQMLFMADNGETGAAYEGIFPLLQDGKMSQSWCSSLFLIGSTYDADLHANVYDPGATNNTDQAWGGNRCRPTLLQKFGITNDDAYHVFAWDMTAITGDDRALFDGVDRLYDNTDPGVFKNGFATTKFSNWRSDNGTTNSATFADMDFFIMRAAEANLTYAEATARMNNGTTTAEGKQAIDELRDRAHAAKKASYSLNDICDEWSREFYFEGRRRVDLIRFGKFGGKKVFPIPSVVITANGFTQNTGY